MIVFACLQCGLGHGLIRGLCEACAPELYADYIVKRDACDAKFAAFRASTGVEPLSDWSRFEQWCESQP